MMIIYIGTKAYVNWYQINIFISIMNYLHIIVLLIKFKKKNTLKIMEILQYYYSRRTNQVRSSILFRFIVKFKNIMVNGEITV